MLTFIVRHLLGIVVVTSPVWGAGILCALIRRDRKNIQGSKTSGSATGLYVSTRRVR